MLAELESIRMDMGLSSFSTTTTITVPIASALQGIRSGLFDHFSELTGLIHFNHDITPTNKLARHVELWDRRPLREFLDSLANGFVT